MIDATSPVVLEPLFTNPDQHKYATTPKQLTVKQIDVHTACTLNAEWHSRFPIIKWGNVVRNKRYVCFVAEKDQIAYATALWSSPIAANRLKNGQTMLELRRMAIADYAPKNTATFMLKAMRTWIRDNFHEIETVISYQDTEAHHGTIYKADNWKAVSQSQISWNDTRQRNKPQSTAAKVRWERRIR